MLKSSLEMRLFNSQNNLFAGAADGVGANFSKAISINKGCGAGECKGLASVALGSERTFVSEGDNKHCCGGMDS